MTTVHMMIRRGQIPKPDTLDGWEDLRAAKRAKNVANAREVLKENELEYYDRLEYGQVVFGVWCLSGSGCYIEYWPEEGRWYPLGCMEPR
jgi:hypothetical protein